MRSSAAIPTPCIVSCALAALLLAGCVTSPVPPPPAPGGPGGPGLAFESVRFETERGPITAILYAQDAPQTVALMRGLVMSGYYDGRSFGRTVPGHVIQVTDAGGAGLTEDARTLPLEASPRLHFSAGALGIARGADPHSGGSEFFIMDYATSHLDGNYTVWGQVVEGFEAVRDIARVPALAAPPGTPPEVAGQFPFDRMAIQPPKITHASLGNLTLPAPDAAKFPFQVAKNVRSGNYRFSLEWPADLRAGAASNFTWYIRPYNDSASLDPATLTMRVEGPGGAGAPALRPNPGFPEILAWTWAPPGGGRYVALLSQQGKDLAALEIAVPP